jgi:hypothetical protein
MHRPAGDQVMRLLLDGMAATWRSPAFSPRLTFANYQGTVRSLVVVMFGVETCQPCRHEPM